MVFRENNAQIIMTLIRQGYPCDIMKKYKKLFKIKNSYKFKNFSQFELLFETQLHKARIDSNDKLVDYCEFITFVFTYRPSSYKSRNYLNYYISLFYFNL